MSSEEIKIIRGNAKKLFGTCTDEQLNALYLSNAQAIESMYQKALLRSNKKFNGYTAEQLKQLSSNYFQLAKQ